MTRQLLLAKAKFSFTANTSANLSWPWISLHLKSAGRRQGCHISMVHNDRGQLGLKDAKGTVFNSVWHNKDLISSRASQY